MYDDGIMRTIVDLPDEQVAALTELCRAQGISRAEAMRRALAEMLAGERTSGRESVFGAWKGRKLDSAKFVRSLREEWEK